jgi:hypothetical protein
VILECEDEEMKKYLDDLMIFGGCICILIGVYQVLPVLTWFIGGGLLIAFGCIFSLASTAPKGPGGPQ